ATPMSTLPPGPRSASWAMLRYLRDPLGVMPALVREHGDPFTFPGKTPLVCTGEPEGIKAIYTAEPMALEPLNTDLAFVLGAESLILIGGPEHRRKRKLMMPPFVGARMRAYGDAMRRLTVQHTADWTEGRTVSATSTAQRLSLDVILAAVFGVHDPEGQAELGRRLLALLEGFSPLLAIVPALRRRLGGVGPYAAFLRRQQGLHEHLDGIIERARQREHDPHDDILSLLVAARYEDGEPMTLADLRAQLLLLVVAGHETTAISIAWALYALHRAENAAVLERLREHLHALGPEPDVDVLAKEPYLDAVCDETLRRFPLAPAPAPRRLLQPLELMGHTLPAGTGVAAAIGVAHLREQTYPEPLRFRPERFMERKFSPFEFLPFGGGSRRCLGAAMAAYEMRIVVGEIIRRFRLKLASERPDPGKVRAANVGPAHGVKLVVEARTTPGQG
ncbi:MAG: cytochrome P450, partial [Myxococcales bacterium]|nr:cytochrome P450 [Myxococcales bacterium]